MKKIVIILFLILFSTTVYHYKAESAFIEKIDLDLDNNEVGLVFIPTGDSRYLYLKNKESSVLLPIYLGKEGSPEKILKMLGENNLEYSYDKQVKAIHQVCLEEPLDLEEIVIVKEKENIRIQIKEQTFCIYNGGTLTDCDYVYFMKPALLEKSEIKLAFYGADIEENFENELYDKWIDLYKIGKEEFTIVKFHEDNYNVIRLPDSYF